MATDATGNTDATPIILLISCTCFFSWSRWSPSLVAAATCTSTKKQRRRRKKRKKHATKEEKPLPWKLNFNRTRWRNDVVVVVVVSCSAQPRTFCSKQCQSKAVKWWCWWKDFFQFFLSDFDLMVVVWTSNKFEPTIVDVDINFELLNQQFFLVNTKTNVSSSVQ